MPTKTIFDKTIEDLTVDKLAALNVHMVLINGTEPMYVSSTGQLFPADKLAQALDFEKQWLSTELPKEEENQE